MKKAIIFLAFAIFAAGTTSAQTTNQVKHCTATTKAGQPCKGKPAKGGSTCVFHKPGPTCGAQTKSGKPCSMKVKTAGAKCHHHSK